MRMVNTQLNRRHVHTQIMGVHSNSWHAHNLMETYPNRWHISKSSTRKGYLDLIFLRHNYPSGDDDMGYNIFVVEFALHTRTTDRFFLFVFNFLSHNYPWGAHDTEYLVHFFFNSGRRNRWHTHPNRGCTNIPLLCPKIRKISTAFPRAVKIGCVHRYLKHRFSARTIHPI